MWNSPTPYAIGLRYLQRFGSVLCSAPEFTTFARRGNPDYFISRYGRLQSTCRRIRRSL